LWEKKSRLTVRHETAIDSVCTANASSKKFLTSDSMELFGPKRDEVTGEWRRLHNKVLYALYSSLNIIREIKSRRLRWAGHVACMGGGEVHTGV
jgi:hypothetical protein